MTRKASLKSERAPDFESAITATVDTAIGGTVQFSVGRLVFADGKVEPATFIDLTHPDNGQVAAFAMRMETYGALLECMKLAKVLAEASRRGRTISCEGCGRKIPLTKEQIMISGTRGWWHEDCHKRTALAAATRRAKTPKAVECEASQSGAAKTAQRPTSATSHRPIRRENNG